MSQTLLQTIYQLGERMCRSLEEGNLDAFLLQLGERTSLIERLGTVSAPFSAEDVAAFQAQQQRLEALLQQEERRLHEALATVVCQRKAHQQYRQPVLRRRLLNKNLHG
ncbi:MAG: hypothetical protein KatS3mg044_0076 [Rhodothermaceae bacterium]|nr:MAG: hypothetical protein D6746_06490 [Bacteroidota bacterium]GIV61210.1 MAG: hypothetical protein KatS3mg044_0076 [Rhodothermaceae bacterium]